MFEGEAISISDRRFLFLGEARFREVELSGIYAPGLKSESESGSEIT